MLRLELAKVLNTAGGGVQSWNYDYTSNIIPGIPGISQSATITKSGYCPPAAALVSYTRYLVPGIQQPASIANPTQARKKQIYSCCSIDRLTLLELERENMTNENDGNKFGITKQHEGARLGDDGAFHVGLRCKG